ncbi:hypothetical protein ACHAXM_004316 [Skeletonema potamos]
MIDDAMNFDSLQYLHAMAPIDIVIDTFIQEEKARLSDDDVWSIQSQGRFAALIAAAAKLSDSRPAIIHQDIAFEWDGMHFLPSEKYVQKLMKRYTTRLEMEGKELEDNNLASLLCHFSMSQISKLPDPADSYMLIYRVPLVDKEGGRNLSRQQEYDLLRIRVYPHHNDVGVLKVWEAGACLADFIFHNANCIRGRRVIELGAGVGLTGLVAANFAKSVYMTDYTTAILENLRYNVSINSKWLGDRGIDKRSLSIGNLEWGEYADSSCCSYSADVLIAADVVYTVEKIPDLVATVSKFLSSGNSTNAKVALFATTFRNRFTFALFELELEKNRIKCDYKSQDKVPYVFPCYFNQPRSDVRICTMTLSE